VVLFAGAGPQKSTSCTPIPQGFPMKQESDLGFWVFSAAQDTAENTQTLLTPKVPIILRPLTRNF
jgi:hypothetical protein